MISIRDLNISLPKNGITLVEGFNLDLRRGQRLILTGASGSGKSTILRAIRGIKDDWKGSISLNSSSSEMCLSQSMSIPGISLSQILSRSMEETPFTDEQMEAVLHDVGLDKLRTHLAINRSQPAFLADMAAPYIPGIARRYKTSLFRLSGKQKDALLEKTGAFLEKHIGEFLPAELQPYFNYPDSLRPFLNADPRKELADSLLASLGEAAGSTRSKMFSGLKLMDFSGRLEKLAEKLGKHLLQAIALELKHTARNGHDFERELSGGEKQKLAIAQAWLHKPDILYMDEPTSALDPVSTHRLYRMTIERLPNTTIFCIAHNRELIPYHTVHGHLENGRIEVKAVAPEAAASEPAAAL